MSEYESTATAPLLLGAFTTRRPCFFITPIRAPSWPESFIQAFWPLVTRSKLEVPTSALASPLPSFRGRPMITDTSLRTFSPGRVEMKM